MRWLAAFANGGQVIPFLFWLAVLVPAAAVGFGLAHVSSDSFRLLLFVILSLAPALLAAFMLWPAMQSSAHVTAGAASVAPIAFAWSAAGVIAYLAGRRLDK